MALGVNEGDRGERNRVKMALGVNEGDRGARNRVGGRGEVMACLHR